MRLKVNVQVWEGKDKILCWIHFPSRSQTEAFRFEFFGVLSDLVLGRYDSFFFRKDFVWVSVYFDVWIGLVSFSTYLLQFQVSAQAHCFSRPKIL